MTVRPKQSWVCVASCGCAFLMIYSYCVLYSSYQWNTKVLPAYNYERNDSRILLKLHFFGNNVTRVTERNSSHQQSSTNLTSSSSALLGTNGTACENDVFGFLQNKNLSFSITDTSMNYTPSVYASRRKKITKLGLMSKEEYMAAKKANRARLLHMKRACQKFSTLTSNVFLDIMTHAKGNFYKLAGKNYLPQAPYSSSYQVDWSDEIMFCWQYKVGSTAWNALFAHLLNQTSVIRGKTFYNMREIMAVKNNREMKKALKFYRFMIVRHPFERLLSAYRDRIEDTTHHSWQRENYGPKILAISRPHLKDEDMKVSGRLYIIPTFSEFVRYLLETHMDKYDPHWVPFFKHCVPCYISYHAIGKSETQTRDDRFILEESGLATKVNLQILEENAHQGRGDTKQLMLKYFSALKPKTLEELYRRYEVDFYLFDYDIQPLLNDLYPGRNVSFASSFQ